MHYRYGYFITVMCGVYVVCAWGQECVKTVKAKKVYVTCQQYLELEGDLTVLSNSFWEICAQLSHNIFSIQKSSLSTINDHVDGEKDCFLQRADKIERTDSYTKRMKIKQELEQCIDDLSAIEQRLNALLADFNASMVQNSD